MVLYGLFGVAINNANAGSPVFLLVIYNTVNYAVGPQRHIACGTGSRKGTALAGEVGSNRTATGTGTAVVAGASSFMWLSKNGTTAYRQIPFRKVTFHMFFYVFFSTIQFHRREK